MTVEPGTVVFCKTNGIMGRIIRLGEAIRWGRSAKWNHVALVDRVEDGVPYVIQAEPHGVTDDKRLDSIAVGGEYVLVPLPQGINANEVLFFARQQVGFHYGFGTIAAIAIDILTPGWFPSLRPANKRSNSWICSALVGESLRFGGWYHRWSDIYLVTPAQMWDALQ